MTIDGSLSLPTALALGAMIAASAMACGGGVGGGEPAAPAAAESGRGDEVESSSASASAPTAAAAPANGPSASPAAPAASAPPVGLSCLAAHYAGSPKQASSAWWLGLPGRADLAWDDGRAKSFDETLDHPDLEDMLAQPYPTGPILPVTKLNSDPGRFRSEPLFKATYGDSAVSVQSQLVTVDFVGQTVKFHARAAAALGRVSARLAALVQQTPALAQYVTGTLGGTFEWRPILNTNRMSAHSYGIAIDVVVSKSDYWEWEKKPDGSFSWTNRIPQAVVDAFESEGFAWGGRWYHYDTMHFEYRPELFDGACR